MTTSKTSTQLSFNDLSYVPDHGLANLLVEPESAEAKQMTVTSGLRCLELSESADQLGSLEKMLLKSSRWHSTRCLLTWKRKATPAGRLLFQLVPFKTCVTGEIESGLWDTPTANLSICCSMKAAQKEARRLHPKGFHNLATQVATSTGCNEPDIFLNVEWTESLMGLPQGWTECE